MAYFDINIVFLNGLSIVKMKKSLFIFLFDRLIQKRYIGFFPIILNDLIIFAVLRDVNH